MRKGSGVGKTFRGDPARETFDRKSVFRVVFCGEDATKFHDDVDRLELIGWVRCGGTRTTELDMYACAYSQEMKRSRCPIRDLAETEEKKAKYDDEIEAHIVNDGFDAFYSGPSIVLAHDAAHPAVLWVMEKLGFGVRESK